MATANRLWRLLPIVPVVAGGVVAAVVLTARSESATTTAMPVAAASPYNFQRLDELVGSSDLVVRGTVVATARGPLVGDGENGVVARLVTVRVDDVLSGTTTASTVLVHEEGWLTDGTPIAVNGLTPSRDGMEAFWFLDALPTVEAPAYLVINHQGRFEVDDDAVRGADTPDGLIESVERLGPDALGDAVRRAVTSTADA